MPVTIATTDDITALARLVNSAYRGERSKKGWTTEAHLLEGARIDEDTLNGYFTMPGVTILKYADNDRLKGCVYLEQRAGKMYLGMLSVDPELQAAGIGRQLLLAAERYAREQAIKTITITVISSRTELISWYERRGFKATGELLPFHHGEKHGIPNITIELLVMEKNLGEE